MFSIPFSFMFLTGPERGELGLHCTSHCALYEFSIEFFRLPAFSREPHNRTHGKRWINHIMNGWKGRVVSHSLSALNPASKLLLCEAGALRNHVSPLLEAPEGNWGWAGGETCSFLRTCWYLGVSPDEGLSPRQWQLVHVQLSFAPSWNQQKLSFAGPEAPVMTVPQKLSPFPPEVRVSAPQGSSFKRLGSNSSNLRPLLSQPLGW